VLWLLRSPLHRVMSSSTMLLTFTGRKSGRTYTTPVNYVRYGEDLLVVGSKEHSWWKNLRGGAPVIVRVRGWEMRAEAEAFEGEEAEEGFLAVIRAVPAYRRYWKVELGEDGLPKDPAALTRIAYENALVRVGNITEVESQ
jgi:deazaflavin-dependent oxidoreductase (nitroreductase family)